MNFALLALPRSGTAWAANFLMDGAICYHDPLIKMSINGLKSMNLDAEWGISCTAYWLYENPSCPCVILNRDFDEVNKSLLNLGLPEMPQWAVDRFLSLNGPRFDYMDLFEEDGLREICSILRPKYIFNRDRFKILKDMHIEHNFEVKPDARAFADNAKILCDTFIKSLQ